MYAIETHDVSKHYGSLRAVAGVDLKVREGEIYGLLGPNGSGKTTLIRLLTGILKPSSGSVYVLGKKIPNNAVMSKIGYMTQAIALYEDLSVRENVSFFASMCGAVSASQIDEIIDFVEMGDRKKSLIRNLSGGMKRRASLACALVHKPELLLLDEPTVGIDPTLRVTFWEYFRKAADQGCSIVVSSHVMDEARRCDRLGFIRDGKLIAEGTSEEVIRRAKADSLEEAFLRFASTKADLR
jgi:ABC-2 type transport system ATP-binding protein